jgi:hypothetical protein
MPVHPAELEAAHFFRSVGFTVEHLAVSSSPRPDLIVRGDALEYLVEVKAKGPSKEWEAALDGGEVAIAEVEQRTTGAWSSVLRDAEEQLRSYEPGVPRLRFALVDVDPRWPELESQLEAALLGSRTGIDLSGGPTRLVVDVDTPQFARFRTLDGVIVFVQDRVRMFLNHHGDQKAAMRASLLARTLGEAVLDAEIAAAAGDVVRAPEEWRPLSDAEKERRCRQEHGLLLVRFTAYSGAARVDAGR